MTSCMAKRKGGEGGGRDGGTVVAKRGRFSFLAAPKEVTFLWCGGVILL